MMSYAAGTQKSASKNVTANDCEHDAEVVIRCQNKDQQAGEELIQCNQGFVKGLIFQLAPEYSDKSDLAQEVFIRMWLNIRHLRNPRALRAWIRQIATNLICDEMRKRSKELRPISMDEPFVNDENDKSSTRDIPDVRATPDVLSQRAELQNKVQEAMQKLPEHFRKPIILRELHEMTYKEIAIITHSEIGTVKSRIARGRAIVQQLIAPYLGAA